MSYYYYLDSWSIMLEGMYNLKLCAVISKAEGCLLSFILLLG